ncbi:MAG TPA: cysteine--tRNA ligase [Caulobacteraceae bacterium]|nr:cysteine--tRNA ligase [Caulobacteraceae bacterium]
MSLVLYDTMTREKRRFRPHDPKRVTMYVCGPTVYNYAHIGNARPVVVFDLLFRMLRRAFGEAHVLYAANVTDVDDKINQKAADEGVPIDVITRRYLDAYHADMSVLGALSPTFEPRATQTMDEIIDMIGRLVRNNCAYAAEGHVLFNTEAYSDYGKLSRRSLEDMIAGARVDVAPYKQNPADFVLWKPSKPGEPVWESPFGPGRPGWHIECSAMIEKTLGLPIDIHGGGNDLIFPHHENEMAQGLCATHGGEYASWWVHNGFLNMGSEKMSKSLGNVILAHDLVSRYPGEALRWALLASHYRQPLAWTEETPRHAKAALDSLYGALLRAADVEAATAEPGAEFMAALEDDLNTPKAYAELFALAQALDGATGADRARLKGELLAAGQLIGFLKADPEAWFQGADPALKATVEGLIADRAKARAAKDWGEADRIRDALSAMNVEVQDGPQGATWRMKEQV